ncbi:MAG: FecR domain-containing protein [Polyangiaceae bacterium]|nr:FecR domain-containing protein [Polyangiaceae bacterium]
MSGDLQELSRQIRELQDAEADAREQPSVEQRMASIHEKLGRRSQERRTAARAEYAKNFLAGALGAAAAVLVSWFFMREVPLSAAVDGEAVTAGAWIASAEQNKALAFSDGSRLTLQANARGRVITFGEHGADFALESGTLHAEVVPRENNHWVIAAGPFEVLVTGTEFDATWDAKAEALSVNMRHGSVRISGSCLSEPRALSGQESGSFSCAPQRVSEASDTSAGSAAPKPAAAVAKTENAVPRAASGQEAPPQSKSATATAPSASAPAAAVTEEDWQALARAGRFKPALAAAEASGFSSLCTSLGADQVLELGNVARLAGNPSRASEAYLSARQRFGGSNAAATAAFQLGRLAFDGARDYSSARRWFGAYLSERPGGGLAQEALGRLMESEHRQGDQTNAAAHAAQYLKRFPGGPHAGLARSIGGE